MSEESAVCGFWVGAVEVLHVFSLLFRIKDERDSAPRCLFFLADVFHLALSIALVLYFWPYVFQRGLSSGALTSNPELTRSWQALCFWKAGMFPGAVASEYKGNLILEHSRC